LQFVGIAFGLIAGMDGPATIIPIPNSHVTSPTTPDFRTLGLAQAVAAESRGTLCAVPALVFAEPQIKSHEGGPRNARHFENVYRVVADVDGNIILLDDVCTSGSHMIAAHWKLHEPPRRAVVLACIFGRTTREQLTHPVGVREEELVTDYQW
jgi:predicted amidophosphoribosyltransferase